MEENRPAYYAVIPADVRYDDRIPANAKLLYGEIAALIGATGYCYASNSFFAENYKMSERTVSGLIARLQECGYVEIVLEKDPQTGQIKKRRIYLKVSSCDGRPVEEIFYTPRKYFREGIEKNFQYINTSNNIIPPIVPLEGDGPPSPPKKHSREYKSAPTTLPDRFEKFWTFYRTNVPAGCNAGNRQKAIRAWDKLSPDANLVTTMARSLAIQVKTQAWISGAGVPHASTWINNHGWEDDWGAAASAPSGNLDAADEEAAEWVS